MLTPDMLLRVLAWSSPAFPTGAFAYSHGLEWVVEAGDVTNRDQLLAWLTDMLQCGTLWTDGVLARQAMRAKTCARLQSLATFGAALATSLERHGETLAQGAAFARAVAVWDLLPPDVQAAAEAGWPLPVVVGAALDQAGVAEHTGCLLLLQAMTANLISAALRLVPLGQTDGLRVTRALEPVIIETVALSRAASLDDAGGCCLAADLAAMRHETQATRLFRT